LRDKRLRGPGNRDARRGRRSTEDPLAKVWGECNDDPREDICVTHAGKKEKRGFVVGGETRSGKKKNTEEGE